MHVLANAVMYHPLDSEMNKMAKAMMEFVDAELNQLLISNNSSVSSAASV